MRRGKTNPTLVLRMLAFPVLLAGVLSGVATAAAPVEEPRPLGFSAESHAVINKISDEPIMISSSSDTDDDYNDTAHLLNTIDQLRQEMMEMRGLLEEHAFRIGQLQQEGRDRYLDLDERVSRLNGQIGEAADQAPVANLKPRMVNAPVAAAAEKKDQSALKAEEAAYQSAFGFIRSRQFDEAKKALQEQLKTYPEGRYADNAHYWLGEVDMAQGDYDAAKVSFQVILNEFPKSPKVADASYKLGRVHDLLGNQQEAKKLLESVIQQYPDSSAAKLSETYLRAMGGS
ncbi:tol-pal system protein YbgF [Endozoicomonas sp. SCSIO W0465]|uniref:tol-pal system protein YbgF n=1 Tax=Endozoicomonas sp. SCSIO W0465 TaxID=2918516 RepID=UPI002075D47D|nr:tol-pal system protein YbgF [Endozoicomonas sp. SCSIO W0465]USE34477.1 tol-pal system protein YbgF [Endozoicomonas sp. SCSIO W0465]